ncbi:MAG: restriction endonuclease subunit S [Flavobacteriales bacterium]|nr:restriction endonuclease subunit S [Flavobacteriales bacterium]
MQAVEAMPVMLMTPRIRFNGFKDAWTEVTLGEIGEFKNGLNKDKEEFGFGYPFVNLMDVFGKNCVEKQEFSLVNASAKDLELYDLKAGDVLFIRSSVKREGVGEAVLVLDDLPATVFSGFLIRFRDHANRLQLHYKKYCFTTRRFRNELLASATTSANTNINQDSLSELRLLVPTLPEQQKIAAFLGAVDRKIQQLKRKQSLLEQYKKGVVQQLFAQELRFKDAKGKNYPEWEEKRLGDVGDIITGKTPLTAEANLWGGDIQFITPTDITENDKYQHTTQRYVQPHVKLKLLPANSIVYTCIASIGKMAMTVHPAITNQQINAVVPSKGYSSEFIYYALLHLTPSIKATQANTTLPIINKTEFSKFLLPIPSLEEQSRIAGFLMALDAKVAGVAQAVAAAQKWKKGLLQKMFV